MEIDYFRLTFSIAMGMTLYKAYEAIGILIVEFIKERICEIEKLKEKTNEDYLP